MSLLPGLETPSLQTCVYGEDSGKNLVSKGFASMRGAWYRQRAHVFSMEQTNANDVGKETDPF